MITVHENRDQALNYLEEQGFEVEFSRTGEHPKNTRTYFEKKNETGHRITGEMNKFGDQWLVVVK